MLLNLSSIYLSCDVTCNSVANALAVYDSNLLNKQLVLIKVVCKLLAVLCEQFVAKGLDICWFDSHLKHPTDMYF